jgi:hypothetical protein
MVARGEQWRIKEMIKASRRAAAAPAAPIRVTSAPPGSAAPPRPQVPE